MFPPFFIEKNFPFYLEVSEKPSIFALAFGKEVSSLKVGVVVQLVRIPACHAGGRGFESRPYRFKVRSYIG